MAIFHAFEPLLLDATDFNEIYAHTVAISSIGGRDTMTTGSSTEYFVSGTGVDMPAAWTTFIFQGYIYFGAWLSGQFMNLREGTTSHARIEGNADGTIDYWRGNQVTLLATSTETITVGTWQYWQIKIVFHDTTGSVLIKVDGTEFINLTSTDTREGGTPLINQVGLHGAGNPFFGSFFFADDSGSDFNDLSTNVLDHSLINPDGVGNSAQFTPSTGANWQTVDEVPKSETDYNESSTDTHKDTFTHESVTADATVIICAIPTVLAENTTAAAASLNAIARHSTSEAAGADIVLKNATMEVVQSFAHVNPSTSVAWTEAEINAMEAGYELSV